MTWPILALISITSLSVALILERVLMRNDKSDPISYSIVFQFLLGAISLVVTLGLGKFVFPDLGLWPRFLLSSVLWAGSTIFMFKSMKKLGAGEVTILSTIGSVVAIFLGALFLKEVINLKIVLGSILIFTSIILVSAGKLSFISREGILFAIISSVFSGIAVVNDAVILQNFEPFSYVSIMSFLPGFVIMALFPNKIIPAKSLISSGSIRLMSVFCAFYSIQAITFYMAYQNGAPVAQLSPITKSSIVLTVILGAFFLNERKNLLKKFIATIIVTIGSIMLT